MLSLPEKCIICGSKLKETHTIYRFECRENPTHFYCYDPKKSTGYDFLCFLSFDYLNIFIHCNSTYIQDRRNIPDKYIWLEFAITFKDLSDLKNKLQTIMIFQ